VQNFSRFVVEILGIPDGGLRGSFKMASEVLVLLHA
jgi:hypothetical protein